MYHVLVRFLFWSFTFPNVGDSCHEWPLAFNKMWGASEASVFKHSALCIFLTWVQKWWSVMSGSFISLVGTWAYCGSSVALRWLSSWIYLSLSLLDKVPYSPLQSVSYGQQRVEAIAMGDWFSATVKVLWLKGLGGPEVVVSWNNVFPPPPSVILAVVKIKPGDVVVMPVWKVSKKTDGRKRDHAEAEDLWQNFHDLWLELPNWF